MIKQKTNESRMEYLLRVLDVYMDDHGGETIMYDDAECDGMCLADDIRSEVQVLIETSPENVENPFAKIFVRDGKQVLAVVGDNDDGNPEVRFTTIYDGLVVSVAPSFAGDDADVKAQKVFNEAAEVYEQFVVPMLKTF